MRLVIATTHPRVPQDTACPLLPFAASNIPDYVRWLVGHAFSAGYEDKASQIRAASSKEIVARSRPGSHGDAADSEMTLASDGVGEVSEAAIASIRELGRMLRTAMDTTPPLQLLRVLRRKVVLHVLPAVAAAEEAAAKASAAATGGAAAAEGGAAASASGVVPRRPIAKPKSPSAAELLDLETYPLGFSTQDATADHAAAILRSES